MTFSANKTLIEFCGNHDIVLMNNKFQYFKSLCTKGIRAQITTFLEHSAYIPLW